MHLKAAAIAAVLLAATAPVGRAATAREIALAELVDRSDAIVYARAVARRSFFDAPTRTIWTETELVVLDGPKGRPGRTVVVTEPGGVVGDVGHLFPGVPQLEPN